MELLRETLGRLRADPVRTRLSLLGVAVGVFAIVAALTLVDSLQAVVREGFASYGDDILFVEREPLEPDLNEDGVFRWWAYAGRPPVTWREYRSLEGLAERAAFAAYGTSAVGVDGDWRLLTAQPLSEGRGFTAEELSEGAPVIIVGAREEAAVSSRLRIGGVGCRVIGKFAPAGMGTVSPLDVDHALLLPYKTLREPVLRSSILLAGADENAVRQELRRVRRLKPGVPDDFAFNRLSFLLEQMDDLFRMVSRLGWLVGLFSLLSGGIGIANMLYVSVQERKPQIGICRALGARQRTILREFLAEAQVLSWVGGLGGIALAAAAIAVARLCATELPLSLSLRAVVSGLLAATALGAVFGLAPARSAAHLAPVEAINSIK